MIIIKADTLELAMGQASEKFECSVTELQIEVVEYPKRGFLGLLKKQAVIAVIKKEASVSNKPEHKIATPEKKITPTIKQKPKKEPTVRAKNSETKETPKAYKERSKKSEKQSFISNQTDFMTPSLVTAQDDYEDVYDANEYKKSEKVSKPKRTKEEVQRSIASSEEEASSIKRVSKERFKESAVVDNFFQSTLSMDDIVQEVNYNINKLFSKTCFTLNNVEVSSYDDTTILVEFTGDDAALLIGKEGYRYKALSYMLFNWINAKYGVQLRLEIAEFLKNQEEMVHKYLEGVNEQINNNGRAQTKILDGVLVQIALKRLRETYPDKYVAIRTNRDGLKYIIINSFRSNNG